MLHTFIPMFYICSHGDMSRLAGSLPPVSDTQLALSIASWLRYVPTHTLVALADIEARDTEAAYKKNLVPARQATHGVGAA